jgi:hypothetical protein
MPASVDRRMRTQVGAGFWDGFKKFAGWVASGARKANDYAKRTQVISKTLDAYGQPTYAAAARQAGYGNRAVTILPGMFRS